jgi:hypothetical protein
MTGKAALEKLREKNPHLPLFSVEDPEFSEYGRVLDSYDWDPVLVYLNDSSPMPPEGSSYTARDPVLSELNVIQRLQETVFSGAEIQAGYCNGFSDRLNALEYHRCSEVNLSPTGLVLLLARVEQIHRNHIPSEAVRGFFLPPGVGIEIFASTLHFTPCHITEKGFRCLVVLTEGTNTKIPIPERQAEGEEALLWMRNKWLIAHPESPLAAKGAYEGITGENIIFNF